MSRNARRWKVRAIPTNKKNEPRQHPRVLLEGTPEECLAYYDRECEWGGPKDGAALVVVDGFDRPVYAAS